MLGEVSLPLNAAILGLYCCTSIALSEMVFCRGRLGNAGKDSLVSLLVTTTELTPGKLF